MNQWVWGNYFGEVDYDNPEACELLALGPADSYGNQPVTNNYIRDNRL